ncbi:Phosphate:acyl-ACP acyltransferase PlsX [Thioalkalivibrio nitratireducens DSM 14787]|uniref:Phosphate acyltransferase n=1 Tax=Thioalkalivibrio nitratireducens (strain DSM 14787 / UNIQEM 213 / ALEN2) TaxID=1255043 RepID=L0DVN6_THIND|nr:phosphate acyltransferase PlsX [Thioalkalivibrio nitratireducens]AGA33045.1 Phosphate:acyl-ACP acyltransferase PlsX [Thioalkalivibrio nitratireducens DSM 14787]
MSHRYTIALDVMSGDHGASVVMPAALGALQETPDIRLVLVGDEAVIAAHMRHWPEPVKPRAEILHASQTVGMEELPAVALRNKKDSSMRRAIDLVKQGDAEACVSAGNTGALMATARYVLKTLAGIDRPAIATALPSLFGHTHMLDLGANVDVEAAHLYQFAVMGSVLVTAIDNNDAPRVGLLNIGSEAIKGNDRVREAAHLLERSSLNYIGFVEGNDVYCSDVDVVVCDGFVGNVALKTSEGVARMILENIRGEFKRSWLTRLRGLVALPVLSRFRSRIDPRRYNGASLLGLQGIVIKSHGGADALAFQNAVRIARKEAEANVPQRIDKQLGRLLRQEVEV